MNSMRERLLSNEMRLRGVWGDALAEMTPDLCKCAEGAVERAFALAGRAMEGISDRRLAGWAQGINPGDLVVLARAYRHFAEERYAVAAREIYVCRLHEEGEGAEYRPPRDPLAIPHRLGDTECLGWFGALPEFLQAECFDEPFLLRIIDHARLSLNHLAATPFVARNIRMTQMDALLTQGLRLDFLAEAAQWREVGLRGLNDSFYRQFNPDGSSIEATGWYHYIVANMALRFWRLKCAMPQLGLQVTREVVARAFDYTAAMLGPDGTFNRIGDSTAAAHPHRTLESFLKHRAAVFQELGVDTALPPCGGYYPDAGQALLREDWGAEGLYITFDVTHRMGFHWHPACNAIQVQLGRHRLIADPGRLHYDPTSHRKMATSTQAHSTITFFGWQQSDAGGRMTFKECDGYTVVTGLYDGGYWQMNEMEYSRGTFGAHHRTLLWIKGRCLVVIDNVRHTEGECRKPTIESSWQFGKSGVVVNEAKRRLVSRQDGAGLVMLFALAPADLRFELYEGVNVPCLGWLADENDQPVKAPLVKAVIPFRDPWLTDLVTVLIPFKGEDTPEVRVNVANDPAVNGDGRVELSWEDGSSDTVIWKPRLEAAIGNSGRWSTDAALIHIGHDCHDKETTALVYEGSFLTPLLSPQREKRETFSIKNA